MYVTRPFVPAALAVFLVAGGLGCAKKQTVIDQRLTEPVPAEVQAARAEKPIKMKPDRSIVFFAVNDKAKKDDPDKFLREPSKDGKKGRPLVAGIIFPPLKLVDKTIIFPRKVFKKPCPIDMIDQAEFYDRYVLTSADAHKLSQLLRKAQAQNANQPEDAKKLDELLDELEKGPNDRPIDKQTLDMMQKIATEAKEKLKQLDPDALEQGVQVDVSRSLKAIAEQFKRVIGYDNVDEILARAHARTRAAKLRASHRSAESK